MNEKNLINLVIGDWSGDGHCQTETIQVESSLNKNELQVAYEAAAKKTKVRLVEAVVSDYEDNMISETDFKKLQKAGIVMDEIFFKDEEGNWDYSLDATSFAMLYLEMIKIVNPAFKYAFPDVPTIRIGGYGLFPLCLNINLFDQFCPDERWV